MQVPNVLKKEYAIADISEDHFVSRIMEDGTVDETLKLPIEDEEIYDELMKVWNTKAGDDSVYFTTVNACGQEKFIAARIRKDWWSVKHIDSDLFFIYQKKSLGMDLYINMKFNCQKIIVSFFKVNEALSTQYYEHLRQELISRAPDIEAQGRLMLVS